MAPVTHVIYPDGDVILVVECAGSPNADDGDSNPSAQSALLDDQATSDHDHEPPSPGLGATNGWGMPEETAQEEPIDEPLSTVATAGVAADADLSSTAGLKDDIDCLWTAFISTVCFEVSSHHLILASSYFRKMLGGGWGEASTLRSNGSVRLSQDHDPEALLVVLNIIHGQSRSIERTIDLALLAKVATVVDQYECHEAMEPYTERWFDSLKQEATSECTDDAMRWTWISQVFQRKEDFELSTRIAMNHSSSPIEDLGLPIKQDIIDDMNSGRYLPIWSILTRLADLVEDLTENNLGCSDTCSSAQLGSLIKQLRRRKLPVERAFSDSSILGLSLFIIGSSMKTITSPPCYTPKRLRSYQEDSCWGSSCDLSGRITAIVEEQGKLDGLELRDYCS